VTPQRFRQLARLERSVHLIRSAGATARFADVAAMAGYSDQAHLNRDWQQLVGCTPRRWWQAEGTG
jgi:AraC-like DNA-binding protein